MRGSLGEGDLGDGDLGDVCLSLPAAADRARLLVLVRERGRRARAGEPLDRPHPMAHSATAPFLKVFTTVVQPLQVCSTSPMTGWYRDGKCRFVLISM